MIRIRIFSLISAISILFLIGLQGCAAIEHNAGQFFEKCAIERAVRNYFHAEITRDLPTVYEYLAPSSDYRRSHTYEEYLAQMESSPVRIEKYDLIEIHDLKANEDRKTYPSVEKFARVEVEITFSYTDTKENMHINYDFRFIKEKGRWYKD
ncbi:MAG: hypothetical protein JRC86_06335 [Deltaproteobacteria bacterium]|nr:hypothetical protein [Deltaproteobacteria bacterium]